MESKPLPLATVTEVRRAFYDEHPEHPRGGKVTPAARVAFGLFVAELARNGEMTAELVGRVTL